MARTIQTFRGPHHILVFGATGLIGSHIIRAIIKGREQFKKKEDHDVSIRVFTSQDTLTRKPAESQKLRDEGCEIVVGSLEDEEDVKKAYEGIDTVISCVGRNMITAQTALIRLAAKSRVMWFFPSEFGTDIEHNPSSTNEIPHQKKLAVRAAMSEVRSTPGVGSLNYTYMVTGPYGDGDAGLYLSANRGCEATGSFDVRNRKAVLLGDGNGKISLTTMKDVGTLTFLALLDPPASWNRALKVHSFTTTDHEILAEFRKQVPGDWEVSYTPLPKLRDLEKEAWETKNPQAPLITLRRIWAEGGTLYDEGVVDNKRIGVRPGMLSSLEEAVREAVGRQGEGDGVMRRKLQ